MSKSVFDLAEKWLDDQGESCDLTKPYYQPDIKVAFIEGYYSRQDQIKQLEQANKVLTKELRKKCMCYCIQTEFNQAKKYNPCSTCIALREAKKIMEGAKKTVTAKEVKEYREQHGVSLRDALRILEGAE